MIHGNYTLVSPIGDPHIGVIQAFNLMGGQYKKIFDVKNDDLCKLAWKEPYRKEFNYFQSTQAHPVPWGVCPYPAGPNFVNKYMVNDDLGDFLPPRMPGGSENWQLKLTFFQKSDGKIVGGYNLYVILRTEETLLGF